MLYDVLVFKSKQPSDDKPLGMGILIVSEPVGGIKLLVVIGAETIILTCLTFCDCLLLPEVEEEDLGTMYFRPMSTHIRLAALSRFEGCNHSRASTFCRGHVSI
jgi:hypothetical protein